MHLSLLIFVASCSALASDSYASEDIIIRDVAILGGGASGTYAGVHIGDSNLSVVLIEKNDYLGGHTNTYVDPVSNGTINYGVQFWHNDSTTRDFFRRLDSPLTGSSVSNVSDIYLDFTKSVVVENYTVKPLGSDYTEQLKKYPYLEDGFILPEDLPEDLLLPWPDYIAKHNVTGSAHASFQAPGPAGNPLTRLSLYLFNFVNSMMISELSGDIVHNAHNDNGDVFRRAHSEIGAANVLLRSTVVHGNRSSEGVVLEVATPRGRKLIKCRTLVVAAPPTAQNLSPLGLDSREFDVLNQVGGYPFYAGVVKNTGLPMNFNYNNVGTNSEFQVQVPPCMVFIYPALEVPGFFYYTYSSLEPLTQVEVEKAAEMSIKRIQIAMQGNGSDIAAQPTFVAFADHSPFHLEQSAESIKNGFYKAMYGLQGYRNTWYIGALFVLSSSQLWKNTATLLPDIGAAAMSSS